jgi:hypothetical protein
MEWLVNYLSSKRWGAPLILCLISLMCALFNYFIYAPHVTEYLKSMPEGWSDFTGPYGLYIIAAVFFIFRVFVYWIDDNGSKKGNTPQ